MLFECKMPTCYCNCNCSADLQYRYWYSLLQSVLTVPGVHRVYVFCRTLVVCSYSYLVPFSSTASDQTAVTSNVSVVSWIHTHDYWFLNSDSRYHPVQLLLSLLISLQSFIPSLLLFITLVDYSWRDKCSGTSSGDSGGSSNILTTVMWCLSNTNFVCRRRKGARTGIVHFYTCKFEVTDNFTFMLTFQDIWIYMYTMAMRL